MPKDYKGEVPEGFDLIDLKPCKMMIFQGAPYDDEVFYGGKLLNSGVLLRNTIRHYMVFEWGR